MTVKGLPTTTDQHDLLKLKEGTRIAIVHARWNFEIVSSLVNKCRDTIHSSQLSSSPSSVQVDVHQVPGSYELPYACRQLARQETEGSKRYDAIIAIGVLIKGETMHFEYIADSVAHGLMRVQLDSGVPVIFGVLTCLNERQAKIRAGLLPTSEECDTKITANIHNHGEDWAFAAAEMIIKYH